MALLKMAVKLGEVPLIPAKARRWINACLLLAAIVAVGAYGWRRLHEGSYQGKPTRYWVQKAIYNGQSSETEEAIIAIGPEAISLLVKHMTSGDSVWHERWVELYDRLPKFLARLIPRPRPAGDHRFAAYSFLNAISDSIQGPRMQSLLPTFIANLSNEDQRPSSAFVDEKNVAMPHGILVRMVSASILGCIGPYASNAVPALIEALGEREKWKYYRSVLPEAIGKIGPVAKEALPSLRQEMKSDPTIGIWAAEAVWRIDPREKDHVNAFLETTGFKLTNFVVRTQAARVHWRINTNAQIVLPVFLNIIEDPANPSVAYTLHALKELGVAARAALPVLSNKLSDKDEDVQNAAEAAIRKINARAK